MKLFSSLLLFIAVNTAVYAQSINGKVTDGETGAPIFSATVYFPGLEKGQLTDENGEFNISGLPQGVHKLIISLVGYSSYATEVTIPASQDMEVRLKPSAIEMEEVIISTPFHQLQSENVMRVARESVTTLNRKGALSLSDGISQIEGVESLTTGIGIGKPVIRGLSSNRVLVYTQGVRLENQQYGDEHGLGISDKGIESVEVIKGPASLLYGSDAIGGVLYLNPEDYASSNSFKVEVDGKYFSNTHGYQGSAMASAAGDRLKFLARGSYSAHSDYETGQGERVTNSRFNQKDFKTGIGYQDNNYKADLRYNFNRSEIGIPEIIGLQDTDKEPLLPYQKIDNHILSLENKLYFNNSSLDFKVGYQFNNRREFEEAHDHGDQEEHQEDNHSEEHPALEMHLETLNYNLKYNLPRIGSFETIAGIQGMHQINRNLGEEVLIPDARTTDFGIFATTHLHLDKWDFQGGIRYDIRHIESDQFEDSHQHTEEDDHQHDHDEEAHIPGIDRGFESFNGALGAKYNITETFTARLNLASGFRAPNLAELTSNGTHHGTNRYEHGNAGLDNEKNFQVDLSLEHRNEHFEAFANLFHNRVSDYIFLNPTGETIDNNAVFEYTQSNATLYGGEIGAHIHPHPLDWLHWETGFDMVRGERDNGENLPLIPANSLTNTFRVEFGGNNKLVSKYAFLRLKNIFDQEQISGFETRTGGYSLLGAGLGGTLDLGSSELQISVNGNNLLNKTYISHLSRLKQDAIPNIGRNISISAQWFL